MAGTGFLAGAVVNFAGVSVAPAALTASSITLSTPPHAAGAVDVTVTNPDGQSVTLTGAFTYQAAAPTLTTLSPTSGPTAGGTNVKVTGTGFLPGATVAFGGDAASVVSVSPTAIVVIAPPHAVGKVSITVRNPDGRSVVRKNAYSYRRW